jgi:HD superfamily phosphohydrolase
MIAHMPDRNRPAYDFSDPVDLKRMAGGDPLFAELVATPAFQRLKSICFLGGIDYLLVPAPNGTKGNIRYTRYQHSLGVARLALLYCEERSLSFSERRTIYVAALLHDVGHAPLSHSLEAVFQEVYGLEHHRATEDILRGRVPLGREVSDLLRRYQVDADRVIAIVASNEPGHDGFFAGPINFDTIEGILRTQKYVTPNANMPSPDTVVEAAIGRATKHDRELVDQFWSCKDWVYRHVINSRQGVLADFACQMFMRRHLSELSAADYFTTESHIFRTLRGLRELLRSRSFESEVRRYFDRSIRYKARRFFVEPSADFFAREDRARYQQTKEDRLLMPEELTVVEVEELRRDLFDEDHDPCNRPGKPVQRRQAHSS